MNPEERARQNIDRFLAESGWVVQEIVDDLQTALEQMRGVLEALEE